MPGETRDSSARAELHADCAGISPDDLPHVFERFWRADKVRSREAGGTGLGLTIAKQIAELHGARLDVRSGVGRGSIFTIRFPHPRS